MAYYYNIRGYIDCSIDELQKLKQEVANLHRPESVSISAEKAALYRSGWCFQERTMNWIQHAFYGGSVDESGAELILEDLRKVVASLPDVEGRFFVESEDGKRDGEWIIRDRLVTETVVK